MTDRLTDEELRAACERARLDCIILSDGVWRIRAPSMIHLFSPTNHGHREWIESICASRLVAMVRERKLHGQMAPKTWGASGGYEGVEEGAVADDVTRIRAAMEVLGDD